MKQESLVIINHIALQFSLAKMRFADTFTVPSMLCDNVYVTKIDPIDGHTLRKAYLSVNRSKTEANEPYAVGIPKQEYLSAFDDCATGKFLNEGLSYLCLGTPTKAKKAENSYERIPFTVPSETPVLAEGKEWSLFVEFLKETALLQGVCSIPVFGYTFTQLQKNPHVAALSKTFSQMYFAVQTFETSAFSFSFLELYL